MEVSVLHWTVGGGGRKLKREQGGGKVKATKRVVNAHMSVKLVLKMYKSNYEYQGKEEK